MVYLLGLVKKVDLILFIVNRYPMALFVLFFIQFGFLKSDFSLSQIFLGLRRVIKSLIKLVRSLAGWFFVVLELV